MKVKDYNIFMGIISLICPRCGNDINTNSHPNFCGHCGIDLEYKKDRDNNNE